MKIVAFVPSDRDEICFGLLEGDRIEMIDDPFATGEVTRTGECVKRQDVVLVNPCFPSKALCIGLNYSDHAKEFGLPVPSPPPPS